MRPQYTRKDISDPRELLGAILATPPGAPGFRLMSVGDIDSKAAGDDSYREDSQPGDHSLLVGTNVTTVAALPLPFLRNKGDKYTYNLPSPFDWALGTPPKIHDPVRGWEGCIPVRQDTSGRVFPNDYLVVGEQAPNTPPPTSDPSAVSWLLCQLLAHRRSRLFGWSLARRIVQVLLPHALLRPSSEPESGDGGSSSGAWILQPALSLFLESKDNGFRSIFSLTLFMIPVEVESNANGSRGDSAVREQPDGDQAVLARTMDMDEIYRSVQAGWSMATAHPRSSRPRFTVSGPLCDYISAIDRRLPGCLGVSVAEQASCGRATGGATWFGLTLRQTAEAIVFATTLRMVAGSGAVADTDVMGKIGERVLVALSASRASSVVVVDKDFDKDTQELSRSEGRFPGSLGLLMEKISGPIEIAPEASHRLDRFFFDEDDYAIGVLPANRCIVMTTDALSQHGYQESGLLEAGWMAYMVIGAATATGMMRSIYHEIEQVDKSKPNAIAAIEHEIVVDLHEIYDLDITWEQYRHRYSLLRDALGITRDYEALQCKLDALSRETRTRFEGRSDIRLAWLTAAIVFLTLVVVIVTMLHK